MRKRHRELQYSDETEGWSRRKRQETAPAEKKSEACTRKIISPEQGKIQKKVNIKVDANKFGVPKGIGRSTVSFSYQPETEISEHPTVSVATMEKKGLVLAAEP